MNFSYKFKIYKKKKSKYPHVNICTSSTRNADKLRVSFCLNIDNILKTLKVFELFKIFGFFEN